MSDPRTREELIDDIAALSPAQAHFCLQALLVAGHVNAAVMQRTLEFADTLK